MSQYHFTSREHTIVLGWDPPLSTYFAQVWKGEPGSPENIPSDHPDYEPEPLLWIGVTREEIPTVETLAKCLKPYATIPAELTECLRAERSQSSEVGWQDDGQEHEPDHDPEISR
jgi:hypothetical protein